VLGTLTEPARRRFRVLLESSNEVPAATRAWQARLAVLESAREPVLPPLSSWGELEQRLFGPMPDAAVAPTRSPMSGADLRRLVVAVLGGVMAGQLLAWAFGAGGQSASSLPPGFFRLLVDAAGHPAVVATAVEGRRRLSIKLLAPVAVPRNRVAELWAVQRNSATFPLGVLPESASRWIDLADAAETALRDVDELVVTFEMAPAMQDDVPTTARVLNGRCVPL
jgi:anti-sigma-K factor RskA